MKLKLINLIPEEFLSPPRPGHSAAAKKNRRPLYFVIIVLAIILLALIPILKMRILQDISRDNLSQAKGLILESKARLENLRDRYLKIEKQKSNLIKEEQAIRQRLELLLSGSSGNRRYSRLILFIGGLLPQELWITRLTLSEAEIQIDGSTLNNQLAAQLVSALDESKKFKNSRFTSSEKQILDAHTIYNFQLSAEPLWETFAWSKEQS